jgi:hypothetical protein
MSLSSQQVGMWAAGEPLSEDTQPVITPGVRAGVTLEVLIYVALACLALTLRLVQLGHAPLDDAEAHQALAALRTANDRAPGEALVARSPLTFALNALSFATLPPSNMAARLPVALAGVLLCLSPALWRRYLHPLPPLIASLLLTISPVTLLAARTLSPVVWTMLLAIVTPWLVLRFVETRDPRWAVMATAGLAAMIFLAEPAGFLTVAALGFGVNFAWLIDDDPETDLNAAIRRLIREWPWTNGLIAAGIMIGLVGTSFFWFPAGLTNIGNTLWEGLRGFIVRPDDGLIAQPIWVGLRYETVLWVFGLVAAYRAVRTGGFFERALVGWALAGTLWALGYAGATSAHALWLTVPVTMLVALAITDWITEKASGFWNVPGWGVPLHALLTVALWMILGINLVLLGKRLLIDLPYQVDDLRELLRVLVRGVYSESTDFAGGKVEQVEVQPNIYVFAYILRQIQKFMLVSSLVPLLNAVLFFLAGSLWGARAGWRGFALGTLAAGLLFSMGIGGRAGLVNPGDPRELWYVHPVTDDVHELRATLREMSLRNTGEPRLIEVAALVPQDGALAWALRDYPNTTFVEGVGPEITSPVVIMPWRYPPPEMGADYIGKDLITRQAWQIESLSWRDAIMWFYRSDSLDKPTIGEQLMMWVRKDVYGVQQVPETQ